MFENYVASPAALTTIIIVCISIAMVVWVQRRNAKRRPRDPALVRTHEIPVTVKSQPTAVCGGLKRMVVSRPVLDEAEQILSAESEEHRELIDDWESLEDLAVKRTNGKYRSMLITKQGIIFPKLNRVYGNAVFLEPSMPVHGAYQLLCEPNSKIESYDPRQEPVISDDTPQKAYRAVRWDIVSRVFAYKQGFWEHFNKVIIVLVLIGAFIIAIAYAG